MTFSEFAPPHEHDMREIGTRGALTVLMCYRCDLVHHRDASGRVVYIDAGWNWDGQKAA